MIPKIIHYCWLSGDEYPDLVKKCLQSWKEKLPGFEFRLWDRACLPVIGSQFANEAFDAKLYAPAADVVRLWAVYHYGGFYLDTDVEVIKDLSPLTAFPYVLGLENGTGKIEAAVFGAEPGMEYLGQCLAFFDDKHSVRDGKRSASFPLPGVMSRVMGKEMRIIRSMEEFDRESPLFQVFNWDYLSPKSFMASERKGRKAITMNTFTFHHFRVAWLPFHKKLSVYLRRILGTRASELFFSFWRIIRNPRKELLVSEDVES